MDSRRNFVRYNRTMVSPQGANSFPVTGISAGTDHQQITAYTLAMVYAPKQCFGNLYDLSTALNTGTIFKELNMPFAPGKRC